ncbi:MAG: family metal transporter [Acidobacteria bacterium]|jgi:ZIP family zinc transporter|nr:family metal transporter [Acidobacteriota bacterium]
MPFTSDNFANAVIAASIAGFGATTLGAVPALFLKRLNDKINNNLLSFAAGVMLAATIFSLLLPAIGIMKDRGASIPVAALQAIAALSFGGFTIWLMDKLIPHKHFDKLHDDFGASRLKKIWLFVFAIAIHNFPEGLSVGVASASGDATIGLGTTFGIALQNIPEGLSVALALQSQGYSKKYSFGVSALTGLVEIFGGAFGAGVLIISATLLPWALAFAAGSMLFIVSDEIIPETHRPGLESGATFSLFVGFGLMMFLDSVFAQ